MTQPCVVVEKVRKVFMRDTQEIPVLEGIDLTVDHREFMALMGPSGSGKTTLLNLIAGIDRPTSGHLYVGGNDITQLSENQLAHWRSRNIGYVFQLYNLIPVLTAYENVELPLLLTPLSRADRKHHVTTALKLVGLENRMDHYPRQLSGGQEQRVGIARAIVTDPMLILADEPTGDLDARSAEEILVLLGRLNKELNKTILMVTHDPRAAQVASTVRHLDKGLLKQSDPVTQNT